MKPRQECNKLAASLGNTNKKVITAKRDENNISINI